MPTYDYVCQDCEHRFEHFQSMTSDPLTDCPECNGSLKRLIGAGAALIFKGSGFYCTDYKDKGKKKDPPDEKKLDDKVDKAKDAAKDTKGSESSSESSGSPASSST